MPYRPKDVVKALKKLGFIELRQKGSHLFLERDGQGVVVPIHNQDLKRGTLRSILKMAGIGESELRELL